MAAQPRQAGRLPVQPPRAKFARACATRLRPGQAAHHDRVAGWIEKGARHGASVQWGRSRCPRRRAQGRGRLLWRLPLGGEAGRYQNHGRGGAATALGALRSGRKGGRSPLEARAAPHLKEHRVFEGMVIPRFLAEAGANENRNTQFRLRNTHYIDNLLKRYLSPAAVPDAGFPDFSAPRCRADPRGWN